ncbi:MAG TPA: oligosaccharide flippase family protein [Bacillota bacterium]
MPNPPARSLARSTGLLALGNAVNRAVGLVYRMILSRFLGAEALGLFQMAMSLYFAILLPFIAGLPSALSQVVAGRRAEGVPPETRRTVGQVMGLTLALLLAAVGLILITGWSPPGEGWDLARRLVPLPLLVPAVACAVVSASLRGVFFGQQRVLPVVSAQVGEQALRLLVLGALLAAVGSAAVEVRLGAVMANLILGEATGCLLLAAAYRRMLAEPWILRPAPAGEPPSLRRVVRIAVPMGLQRAAWSFERLAEATLIPAVLQRAGSSVGAAVAAYGELTAMASPLIFLPNVAVHALTHTLVPGVAEVANRPSALHHRVRRALSLTADLGTVTTLVLTFTGGWLTAVLFGFNGAGAGYPFAGRLAERLALLAAVVYVDHVATAVLRGLERSTEPMLVDFLAMGARLGLLLALGNRLALGIEAVVTSLTAAAALAAVLDLLLAGHYSGMGPAIFKPVLPAWVAGAAGLAAGGTVRLAIAPLTGPGAAAAAALAAALVCYGLVRLGAALSHLGPTSGSKPG